MVEDYTHLCFRWVLEGERYKKYCIYGKPNYEIPHNTLAITGYVNYVIPFILENKEIKRWEIRQRDIYEMLGDGINMKRGDGTDIIQGGWKEYDAKKKINVSGYMGPGLCKQKDGELLERSIVVVWTCVNENLLCEEYCGFIEKIDDENKKDIHSVFKRLFSYAVRKYRNKNKDRAYYGIILGPCIGNVVTS